MPIRFRCVYCNQLLGISRRKAGTIVRCTACEGQLIVPDPNEGATDPAPLGPEMQPTAAREPPAAPKPDIFEQGDFDALLEPYRSSSPAAVASPPKSPSARPKESSPSPAPAVGTPVTAAGLVLSRAQLTIISVVLVLTLGLAFAGGLLLGLSLRGG